MDRLISPVHDDWGSEGAAASAIAAWEHVAHLRLPDDYRRFLLRYNGGRPYPNMFKHTALDPNGFESPSEAFVDPFYDWERVVSWSNELAKRLPPKCLAIGADPGLLEIVLSLRKEDHGAVFSWVRNWDAWGSAENSYLCPQAASFGEFVASLFDDDGKTGNAFWHTLHRDRLKRTIEI